jgi:uncharacterized protein (DUF1330 family)
MPSYAIAHLHDVKLGDSIVEYLAAIDATLAPFGGRYLIHGGTLTRIEGRWPDGDMIVIEFPDRAALDAWYTSDAYRRILPLRTENSAGDVVFVDGVGADHRAIDVLSRPDTGAG